MREGQGQVRSHCQRELCLRLSKLEMENGRLSYGNEAVISILKDYKIANKFMSE